MFCASAGRAPWIDRLSHRFFAVSFKETFRKLLDGHRKRRAPGGGASIDARLERGGSIRLAEVDKVLESIGEPPLGPLFLAEVEAYLAITGTKAYLLGQLVLGDPSFVTRLRAGRSPYLGTVDRVRAWMGEHSTAAERCAIGAATLHTSWWRLGVGAPPPEEGPPSQPEASAAGPTPFRTELEAARWLNVGKRTLRRLRSRGEGPPHHEFGQQIRYLEADLHAWAEQRRRQPGDGGG